MLVAGINAYHGNSSVCLFENDRLILAIEEERLNRIKNWAGFPAEALRYCLSETNLGLDDIDYFAISRDPKANMLSKLWTVASNPRLLVSSMNRARNAMKIGDIGNEISKAVGTGSSNDKFYHKIYNIEHHRCHLASSFYASPHTEAALLSVDGMGDFSSVMMAYGTGSKIQVLNSVKYPHSIGYFYTALTQYLGFPNYGDEYKVMGLAPYGQPRYADALRKLIRPYKKYGIRLASRYFDHFKYGVKMSWQDGQPSVAPMWSREVEELLGPARKKGEEIEDRHKDIAASLQQVTEEMVFFLADSLYNKIKSEVLCLSGGVAQNSVANGKILENTKFKALYVPPAAHDAGTSVGAALYLRHAIFNQKRSGYKPYAYTGMAFSNDKIVEILERLNISYLKCSDDELLEHTCNCILQNGVVGWFHGRSEFGPRALGNRSILADPRNSKVRELINRKIKRRESFRPFAPSVLKERVDDFFESAEASPYMEKVYKVRKCKRNIIPAVTHVDGTGRIQTVDLSFNKRYYKLIEKFEEKTQVPVLLNTSFNENEPIVNTPEEAIDCFLRTEMDMLVLENMVVRK